MRDIVFRRHLFRRFLRRPCRFLIHDSSRRHLEAGLKHLRVLGTPAGHDLERARLDDVTQRSVVEAELFARDGEVKRAALAGLERDALESLQLFDGARARGRNVARVELYDLVARAPARVLHVNAYVETSRGVDARRAQSKVRQAEGRVAEAVAEGEERRPWNVKVFGRV